MVYPVKKKKSYIHENLTQIVFGTVADMKHLFVSLVLITGLVVFSFILSKDILSYTCTLLVTLEEPLTIYDMKLFTSKIQI